MNTRYLAIGIVTSVVALPGCMRLQIEPEGKLPAPLVVATPATVAVVISPEMRNYTHNESRAGVDYDVLLGKTHTEIMESVFKAEFAEAKLFPSIDEARLMPGVLAIFEPRIEQYSFATAKETGGIYCAVTIRYQIKVYTPAGESVDTLTLTGYGSSTAPKVGNGEPELSAAAFSAMRDAAAKFLTQFPQQELAKPLLASQPIKAVAPDVTPGVAGTASKFDTIEIVPINETSVIMSQQAAGS
jgi:hypothetical protein